MPSLLARYRAGEHVVVWAELGTGPLPIKALAGAEAVARETMRRVRRNIELLIERLLAEGYPFAHPLAPRARTPRRATAQSSRRPCRIQQRRST
jgi:hypothetical protein